MTRRWHRRSAYGAGPDYGRACDHDDRSDVACGDAGCAGADRGDADRTGDSGSVLLLAIGYALLALAVILVCADATSLYLAQKRLDAAADGAALAAADGFTLTVAADGASARLTDDGVRAQADAYLTTTIAVNGARLEAADAPDARSARVTVGGTWHPPIITVVVPAGIALHATATSRTALR